ncbi:unnamed protein product [Candidula unifasciata]|uniref:SOWAHA-C winged helix-turn-helix domain-containing protein n=1 Tax=Candidula unifasciata TaxID=100452 RepID=A0A8S3ZYY2_9EUPU|nr:unnamed protein product [Candidula unifasciata]
MGDFEIEDVLYFIISKGCRVKNHELVTHFRNFLNHPVNKVQNRDKFKNFVNELATVKIDEGDKVLVLKKKYRPPSENCDTTSTAPPLFPAPQTGSRSAGAWVPKKTVRSEPDLSTVQSSALSAMPPAEVEDRLAQNDSLRAQSEPPSGVTGNSDTDLDNPDGLTMSKVRSDESLEVVLRHTDRLPAPVDSDRLPTPAETESQKSLASSTSGLASMDEDANASVFSVKDKIKKLNKNISESDVNQPKSVSSSSNGGNKKMNKYTAADDDDTSHSSGSFVSLDDEQKDWMVVCSHSDYHEMNRLLSKNPSLAKIKDFTNTLFWETDVCLTFY